MTMTDDSHDSHDSHELLSGEIVGPEGPGNWMPVPAASALTGTPQKTLYRRIERHQVPSRRNAEGRIEVWVPVTATDSPHANAVRMTGVGPEGATDTRLSPVVGLNTLDVRELLAPLAQALTDSQRDLVTATTRAVRAEVELEAARARIADLETRQPVIRSGRMAALASWWRFWVLGEAGDSRESHRANR